ncbi:BNR repeat-like domain protein [Candidatus Tiddalikarchaeum anstoanum]|nr:BNR repeat-like domain protein [Candidatus Tiddalikarchaeum anstoanum]
MTVVSVAASFIWVTEVSTNLEENAGSSISQEVSSCSGISLISMRGDEVLIQNTGCDTINNITLLIDGVLTDYDLSSPLTPGESTTLSYTNLAEGEDHCVKISLGSGATSQACSNAIQNTLEGGYGSNFSSWFSGCPVNNPIVDFDNKLTFELSDNIKCGCHNLSPDNLFGNPSFEDDSYWTFSNATINSSVSHSGSRSAYLYRNSALHGASQSAFGTDLDYNIENLNFYALVSSNSTGGYYTGVMIEYRDENNTVNSLRILYIVNSSSALIPICGGFPDPSNTTYVDCSAASGVLDVWQHYSITGIHDEFHTIWPANFTIQNTKTLSFTVQNPFGSGIGEAYYDDIFTNATEEGYLCDSENDNGVADGLCSSGNCISQTADASSEFCTAGGYTWFTGTIYGTNGACCGDDGVSDSFVNNSAGCCDGSKFFSCTDNSIGEKFCVCVGASYIDTCGDNICQSWENASTCSYDCPSWGSDVLLVNYNNYTNPVSDNSAAANGNNIYFAFYGMSGARRDVYFMNSSNYGVNWSIPMNITKNTDIDSAFCNIAVNGSKLLITDNNAVIMRLFNSSDGGVTWSNQTLMNGIGPMIATNNNNIYLVYKTDSAGKSYVNFANSSDYGVSWSNKSITTNGSDLYAPTISNNGDNLHVIWRDDRYGIPQLFYKRSTDGGITWSSDMNLSGFANDMHVATSGNYVHIIYTTLIGSAEIVYIRSTDGGITWSNYTILSIMDSRSGDVPSLAVYGSDVYVVWQELGTPNLMYSRWSNDDGLTWSNYTQVTSNTSYKWVNSLTATQDGAYFFWDDYRNGNADVYYNRFATSKI